MLLFKGYKLVNLSLERKVLWIQNMRTVKLNYYERIFLNFDEIMAERGGGGAMRKDVEIL